LKSTKLNENESQKKISKIFNRLFYVILFFLFHFNFAYAKHYSFESKNAKELIVFIHGTKGDSKDTWYNERYKFFFPEKISKDKALQENLGGLDVVSYGYTSNCIEFSKSVSANSSDLFDYLIDKDSKKKYRRITIITHSLGGILVKRMILSELKSSLLKKIKIVVNLGVPHWGATNLYDYIRDVFSNTCPSNDHLKELDARDGSFLDKLNSEWREKIYSSTSPKRFIYAAGIELKDYYSVGGRVVPKYSATQYSTVERTFNLDHAELAKPDSSQDYVYQWVKDLMLNNNNESNNITTSVEKAIRDGYDDMQSSISPESYKKLLTYIKDNNETQIINILKEQSIKKDISPDERIKLFAAYYASKTDFTNSIKLISGKIDTEQLRAISKLMSQAENKETSASGQPSTWWPFNKSESMQMKRTQVVKTNLKTNLESLENASADLNNAQKRPFLIEQ